MSMFISIRTRSHRQSITHAAREGDHATTAGYRTRSLPWPERVVGGGTIGWIDRWGATAAETVITEVVCELNTCDATAGGATRPNPLAALVPMTRGCRLVARADGLSWCGTR